MQNRGKARDGGANHVRGLPLRRYCWGCAESAPIQALADGVSTFDPLRELLEQSLEEELPAEIKVDARDLVIDSNG